MQTLGTMHDHKRHHDGAPRGAAPMVATDPICGMAVGPTTPYRLAHEGRELLFCSARCLERFRAGPAQLAPRDVAGEVTGGATTGGALARHGRAPSTAAAPTPGPGGSTCPMHPEIRATGAGSCPKCGMALEAVVPAPTAKTEWTCPMHPEIVRDAPGVCPKCGMALEPRAGIAAEGEENAELRDMTRRFWFATLFTVPLVVIAMGRTSPPSSS